MGWVIKPSALQTGNAHRKVILIRLGNSGQPLY